MAATLSNISVQHLKRALVIREKIERLERDLESLLGGPGSSSTNGHGGRRRMSAAARAKIAAAQKLRWAKYRKGSGKGRRKMSAAARAKISAAAKARWAKAKAANRRTLAR
jgi:hypothetical protein